jgi:hypothetical protein
MSDPVNAPTADAPPRRALLLGGVGLVIAAGAATLARSKQARIVDVQAHFGHVHAQNRLTPHGGIHSHGEITHRHDTTVHALDEATLRAVDRTDTI